MTDFCECPVCNCKNEIYRLPILDEVQFVGLTEGKLYGKLRLRMCKDCLKENHRNSKPSSIEILKMRLARGEISVHEFEQLKRKLLE